ncbi:MAG TPA: hypothetical protein VFY65_07360 [Longimicrobium sp.]|nr:hypothetical protein [Longimicrobium sp.]
MRLLRSLLLVVTAAALAACGSGSTLPETDADFAGRLADFVMGPASLDAATRVLVQREEPGTEEQRIVHVEVSTDVYVMTRGQLVPASRADLQVGDLLQVWTTGVELRSLPAQVFATRVHIIR